MGVIFIQLPVLHALWHGLYCHEDCNCNTSYDGYIFEDIKGRYGFYLYSKLRENALVANYGHAKNIPTTIGTVFIIDESSSSSVLAVCCSHVCLCPHVML